MKIKEIIQKTKKELNISENVSSKEFNENLLEFINKSRKRIRKDDTIIDFNKIINSPYSLKLKKSMGINTIKVISENQYLPLKRWEKTWGIPQKFKLLNYKGKKSLFGFIETKKTPKHPFLWKQYPTKVFYEKERNGIWLKIVNWNKFFIPDLEDAKNYMIKEKFICIKIPKDHIALWSLAGLRTQSLLFPKSIYFDEFLLECIGLLWGEMSKSIKGSEKRAFSFTNNKYNLINNIIKFLTIFGISKENLLFEISINKKYENESDRLTDYWSERSRINKNKIKLYFNEKKMEFPGTASLKYISLLFKFLMLALLEYSLYLKLDKISARSISSGILAAEGSVVLKYDKLENVSMENLDMNLINLFVECLNTLEIAWKSSYIKIFIQGWKDYWKIYNNRLLELNPFQHYKFLKGLYNYKESQELLRIKSIGKSKFTIKEFLVKFSFISSHNVLRKMKYLSDIGFLKKHGNGTKKSPYLFVVTDELLVLLNDFNIIEEDIKRLEDEYPNFKYYLIKLKERQYKNMFKLKNRDNKFFKKMVLGMWFNLKEIEKLVECSRGHVTTVMPWLERKGYAEKEMRDGKMYYRIIKSPLLPFSPSPEALS